MQRRIRKRSNSSKEELQYNERPSPHGPFPSPHLNDGNRGTCNTSVHTERCVRSITRHRNDQPARAHTRHLGISAWPPTPECSCMHRFSSPTMRRSFSTTKTPNVCNPDTRFSSSTMRRSFYTTKTPNVYTSDTSTYGPRSAHSREFDNRLANLGGCESEPLYIYIWVHLYTYIYILYI